MRGPRRCACIAFALWSTSFFDFGSTAGNLPLRLLWHASYGSDAIGVHFLQYFIAATGSLIWPLLPNSAHPHPFLVDWETFSH